VIEDPSTDNLVELLYPEPGIALLRLNDPSHLNAMSNELAEAFAARLRELHHVAPRAVVLTGAGRAFSAGGDLEMLERKRSSSIQHNQAEMQRFYHLFLDILELEVPLVAAINGWAVGAGFCLACACDIRVCDPEAGFSVPFLKLGLFPGMGTTSLIPRVLGPRAFDLLLTGRRMKADEALQSGLVSRHSQPGESLALGLEVAREITAGAQHVTRQLLRILRGDRQSLMTALQTEAFLQGASYATDEFRDGVAAARARRPDGR
jgi:enoyl-CoA hydratase/carnithine racemase